MAGGSSLLKISVLDVGHGDFIYAETPKNHRLVIDCGSGDVVPSEFLSKVTTIDELEISHPHEDHFTDVCALAEKNIRSFRAYQIDEFRDEQIAWRSRDRKKIHALRALAARLKCDNAAVAIGDGFSHCAYYPKRNDVDPNDPNTASIITTLSYGSFKMLFGADQTEDGWKGLLADQAVVAAVKGTIVYKVSHHGREVGCSPELMKVISPTLRLCVMSDKTLDSTNEETECVDWYRQHVIASGAKVIKPDGSIEDRRVLTTRKDGSIHIQVEPDGTWRCYKDTRWKR
jgi:beta-lactamase superfamily II metal-dependent hydrolase